MEHPHSGITQYYQGNFNISKNEGTRDNLTNK